MEVLLNALWLLATAGGIAWAVCGRDTHHKKRHSSRLAVIALGCVLLLLFPVISVTDDLHLAQGAIEDVGPKKLKSASDGDRDGLRVLHIDVITDPGLPSLLHADFLATAVVSLTVHSLSLPVRMGRAPPSPLF